MKFNSNIFKICFLLTAVFFSSCETVDLDQTENPSGVSVLDPVFAFNYVQLQLPQFVHSANGFTQEVTRQMAMTSGNTYDNAYQPVSFNNNWSIGYNLCQTVKIMEPKCRENQEYYALGAAKVMRAYVLMTMVDMYGDIPFSEALQGNNNLTPKYDNSADVYKQLLLDLDEAISILQLPNSTQSTLTQNHLDLYYTSQTGWITLAKTLKLKMYSAARLAGADIGVSDIGAAMSSIIDAGDYIDTPDEDFVFKYGNSRFSPNTRHPVYNDQYELNGGAYLGNYMMWAMTTEKVSLNSAFNDLSGYDKPADPRVPFYFYKQDPNPADDDAFTLPNRVRPDHYNESEYASFYDGTTKTPFKVSNWVGGTIPANGFWGRDHGDNSGIPPDADKRTVVGVYPAGGAYGSAGSVQTSGNKGALGAGIMPILLSSYVHFMKAEAMLTLGISGSPKAEMHLAISQSIQKSTHLLPDYPVLTTAQSAALANKTTAYLDLMDAQYDAALNNDKKLELIIKEYYIAAWGNGIEPYNNYRRTGYPSNFQPTLEPIPGVFYNTALYPSVSVVNNPNAPANVRTKKVFWDKANVVLH